ncbi:MAG TPA: hypothetical protein VN612_00800 [Acidobacteriaceae bacterium]|nr:hypothetical protein [Acidobacteriaceae bacterium]
MSDQTRTRQVIVSIGLIVLLMAVTLGMVWHHHDHGPCNQCTLCHLVIDQPVAVSDGYAIAFAYAEPAPRCTRLISRIIAWKIPSRAPPV